MRRSWWHVSIACNLLSLKPISCPEKEKHGTCSRERSSILWNVFRFHVETSMDCDTVQYLTNMSEGHIAFIVRFEIGRLRMRLGYRICWYESGHWDLWEIFEDAPKLEAVCLSEALVPRTRMSQPTGTCICSKKARDRTQLEQQEETLVCTQPSNNRRADTRQENVNICRTRTQRGQLRWCYGATVRFIVVPKFTWHLSED